LGRDVHPSVQKEKGNYYLEERESPAVRNGGKKIREKKGTFL